MDRQTPDRRLHAIRVEDVSCTQCVIRTRPLQIVLLVDSPLLFLTCLFFLSRIEDTSTPWDTMVSLDDFRQTYQEVENSLNATPKLANRKSSLLSDGNFMGTRMNLVDNNSDRSIENGRGSDYDEFRIRRLQEYETSFIRSMNEHPTRGIPVLTPLQHLLEEVAIIMPSVFRNITGSNTPNPHLIIRPSYFDNVSDEEQFLILSTHSSDDNHSFLSFRHDMTNDRNSLNWLRRMTSKDDPRKPTTSLSSFLLARFEWAAWESFLEFEFQKPSNETEHNESPLVEADGNSKNHVLSILGDVLSHCRAVNDRSLTIDSSTLESFVAPLVKTCFTDYPGTDPVTVDDVQHVILTPLSWVWFASQRRTRCSHDVMDDIDRAVESSLERMDNDKEMSGTNENTAADNIDQHLQKKRKKKNKKKKVRYLLASRLSCLVQRIISHPDSSSE